MNKSARLRQKTQLDRVLHPRQGQTSLLYSPGASKGREIRISSKIVWGRKYLWIWDYSRLAENKAAQANSQTFSQALALSFQT